MEPPLMIAPTHLRNVAAGKYHMPRTAAVTFADFEEVYQYNNKVAVTVSAAKSARNTVDLEWSAPESVNIFFGNVTHWGPQAANFVFDAQFKAKYQYAALVETHTKGSTADDLEAKARAHGFRAHCNHAQPSLETKGSHGGEVILSQEYLYAIPVAAAAQEVASSVNDSTSRYTACEIRVGSCPILLITTYFWCGEKWSSSNYAILHKLLP